MKILLSGVNPTSYGHVPRMGYIHSVKAVVKYLKVNHQVDVRPVKLGENFQEYDRVILFLASMRGFISKGTLGVLWALHAAGEKVTISFDDWQIRESLAGIRNLCKEFDKIMDANPFSYIDHDKSKEYREILFQQLKLVSAEKWSWPVTLPCYESGNLSLLSLPEAKITTYNPSVAFKGFYADKYASNISPPVKSKKWVLAALHNHGSWLKKQKVKWPVNQFGHRSQGQPRVTEEEICREYASSWGVLSPAYKISGSGWWRARYGLAADVFSVAAGDPKELAMIDAASYGVSPAQVEELDDHDLTKLAKAQSYAYYAMAGTEDQLIARIQHVFLNH